jgi:hypothetical protein
MRHWNRFFVRVGVVGAMSVASVAQASIYIGPPVGGDWHDPENWSDGSVPNGIGAVAEFINNLPISMTMSAPVVLGTLVLNNQSALSINPGAGGGIVNGPDDAVSIAGGGIGSTVFNRGVLHCEVVDGRLARSSLTINGLIEGNGDPYSLGGFGNVTLNGGFHGTINVTGSGVMTIVGAANSYDVGSVHLLTSQSLFLSNGVAFDVDELAVNGQPFPPGVYTFGDGTITVVADNCPSDVTGNNVTDVDDLLSVINGWGPCPPPCASDITGNGNVDVDDLLAVINGWGPCP